MKTQHEQGMKIVKKGSLACGINARGTVRHGGAEAIRSSNIYRVRELIAATSGLSTTTSVQGARRASVRALRCVRQGQELVPTG
jgi:hypothetical protein